jgi:mannose-6-phosphate isomerase-like protein (cupin superfamily)
VSEDYLSQLGILYHHCPSVSSVDQIASARSYKNRDEITVSPDKMGAVYEEKVKMFFNEHLHEDEEIRYILDGNGFFDVRDPQDEWVRIRLEKDDLIILPAGIFHRFTTDSKNVGMGKHPGLGGRMLIWEPSTSKPCGCLKKSQSGRHSIVPRTLKPTHTARSIFRTRIQRLG